jgi:hypothetical protein
MPRAFDDVEEVFIRPDSLLNNALLWLAAGLFCVMISVLGFCLALFTSAGVLALHVWATLPAMLATGAFIVAWTLGKAPREVSVDSQGITIERRTGTRTILWKEIGWSSIGQLPITMRNRLILHDLRGRPIEKIDEGIEEFDRLKKLVSKRVAARKDGVAKKIQTSHARTSAVALVILCIGGFTLAGVVARHAYTQKQAESALQEQGVDGEAEIIRRYLAPNGITGRLEYRVTTPDGRSATRDTEVIPLVWRGMEGQTTVSVIYLPDDPTNSRLAIGEARHDELTQNSTVMYIVCGTISGLCVIGLVVAIMSWFGWSIDMDPDTGIPFIKRREPAQ